jgi:peptidoglycan/xylan/chitin deacetylase (PgdA/CDA1 family)
MRRRRVQKHVARAVAVRLSRPIVSFAFDGFPKSAARTGAGLLENVGGHGTFYASAGFAGETIHTGDVFEASDVTRLLAAGHEIGCHTLSALDCARTPIDQVFSDMVRNADALAAMGMEARLVSFAWPYGEATHALKDKLPSRFTSARGMMPGVATDRTDLAQLRAHAMFGPHALPRCLAALELARGRNGWVIFHTHDVSARPSPWGAPTGLLERLCGAAFAGGFEILPVRDATARIVARRGMANES